MYKKITPWEHIENESFDVYKAHIECDEIWKNVGADCDWLLPNDRYDWDEMVN